MGRVVYLNGQILPEEQARISILDRGFLYGDGLFETMRAYSGRVFRLGQHYQRVAAASERIGLGFSTPQADVAAAVAELLGRNGLQDAYVRLTVSRGEGLGMEPPEPAAATVAIIARPLSLPDARLYREGAAVTLLGPASGPALAALKSLSYLDRLLARRAARQAGTDDAVLTNSAGHLTEASSSNVFLVKDGVLCTPALECGLLAGITRQAVLEVADEIGMPAREGEFTAANLLAADECFLTNSIAEILPVTRVGDRPVGPGRPGDWTRTLTAAFRRLVARELGLAPAG